MRKNIEEFENNRNFQSSDPDAVSAEHITIKDSEIAIQKPTADQSNPKQPLNYIDDFDSDEDNSQNGTDGVQYELFTESKNSQQQFKAASIYYQTQ